MDGSTSYNWSNNSVWSSDETTGYGWLKITFTQAMELDKVIIHNRTDCCWDRLNGVAMRIKKTDSSETVQLLTGDLTQSYVFSNTFIPDSQPVPVEKQTPVLNLPSPTEYFGIANGIWAGNSFSKVCNATPSDYVSNIDVKWGPISDWQGGSGTETDMSQIIVKCASGSTESYGSNAINPNHKIYSFDSTSCDGFTGARGRAGWGMTKLDMNCNGFKNTPMSSADGGNPWTFSCPVGKTIRAVHGKHGDRIGSLGFVCN